MSETNPIQKGMNAVTMMAIGATIGAGLALLYAPQSGKETRRLIIRKARQLKGRAQGTVEDARKFAHTKTDDLADALHARDGKSKQKRAA